MTTREDLEQRRVDVSDAACRVLARDGLGALSVRGVAAEAGLPPSTVRYVFPTQAAMREHAITLVFDRTRERIDAIPVGLPDAETARRILVELLPLDDERVVELDVYLALGNAALTDDALRPALDRVVAEMRAWCEPDRRAGRGARGRPRRRGLSAARLVDGLCVHVTRLAPGSPASGRSHCSTGTWRACPPPEARHRAARRERAPPRLSCPGDERPHSPHPTRTLTGPGLVLGAVVVLLAVRVASPSVGRPGCRTSCRTS